MGESLNEKYSVDIARSIDEVEKLRQPWEEMQQHPNADIDYFSMIVNTRREILRPHVMMIRKQGIPHALIIGRLEEHSVELKLGYITLFKPKVRSITVIYSGILGTVSEEICNVILAEIQKALKQGEADVAYFNFLNIQSALFRNAKNGCSALRSDHIIRVNAHWKMLLPQNRENLFEKMNSKHRSWLKRLPRVLEKDYPGRVEHRVFRNEADVDQLCVDAEAVARKTYQRAIGAGFIDNVEHRKRMHLAAKKGWLIAYIMYIETKPAAFWIGDIYKGTCYLHFTGYDAEYRKYETGTILLTKMIEDIFELNAEVREIDFGFGDALYKQKLCNEYWQEAPIYIFAPTVKAILINGTRTINNYISRSVEKYFDKYEIKDKLKKKWRDQLRSKQQSK
jgi:hypothetical protein